MYSEMWDVDVNHNEDVYVVQDEAEDTGDPPEEELPFEIPRD